MNAVFPPFTNRIIPKTDAIRNTLVSVSALVKTSLGPPLQLCLIAKMPGSKKVGSARNPNLPVLHLACHLGP